MFYGERSNSEIIVVYMRAFLKTAIEKNKKRENAVNKVTIRKSR